MDRLDGAARTSSAELDASQLETAHPAFHVWRSRGDTASAGAWYGTRRGDLTAVMEAAGLLATVVAETCGELDEKLTRQDKLAARVSWPLG